MKKTLISLAGLALLALSAFLLFAPSYVDGQFNNPLDHTPYAVSPEAKTLYDALPGIADMHADPLLWKRDLSKRNTRGHIDVPRLVDGRIAVQVFGAVTKTPRGQNYEANSDETDNITLLAMSQLWPVRTWRSLEQRALYQAEKLQGYADGSAGLLVFARTRQDLAAVMAESAAGGGVTAGFMGLEGAHALEGDLAAVDRLFDAGYRMLGLAHFFDNEVAGSVHGIEKYGLTELGRRVVKQAQDLGMMVDLAHSSHKTIADVLEITQQPLIYSHGGVKGTCDTNRNLRDDEVVAIAGTGGLIALGAWDAAACGVTPADLAKAMAHVKGLVGANFIAIGSDFDGAVKTAFTLSDYDVLVDELLNRGFTTGEIEDVMGGNAVRVFSAILPDGN